MATQDDELRRLKEANRILEGRLRGSRTGRKCERERAARLAAEVKDLRALRVTLLQQLRDANGGRSHATELLALYLARNEELAAKVESLEAALDAERKGRQAQVAQQAKNYMRLAEQLDDARAQVEALGLTRASLLRLLDAEREVSGRLLQQRNDALKELESLKARRELGPITVHFIRRTR